MKSNQKLLSGAIYQMRVSLPMWTIFAIVVGLRSLPAQADPIVYANPSNASLTDSGVLYINIEAGTISSSYSFPDEFALFSHVSGASASTEVNTLGNYATYVGVGTAAPLFLAGSVPSGTRIDTSGSIFAQNGGYLRTHDDSTPSQGFFPLNQATYLPIVFYDGTDHFGWINITMTSDSTATVNSFAYETTPDASIVAAAPEPATVSVASLTLAIVAYGARRYFGGAA